MTYQLGIDVGTTTVVAAVRHAEEPGAAEIVPLGTGGATVPSALHLARDGGVTVGDGALRLAGIDAGRVIRALPRRIGDPTPITLGGGTWTAEDLFARLVRWVVDRVAEHESGPAARITLAHPAPWGPQTLERVAAALAGVDVHATFLAEPQAVAQAARADGEPGDTIAVYDFGGGRFDAAVVRRGPAGFDIVGRPEPADLGGLDLDELIWRHVRDGMPEGMVLDASARRACLRAKETLSTKAEAVVRVKQGELRGDVRLDRGTFEGLVAAHVDRTAELLRRVVASAGVAPEDLTAVLLTGGSSRIPLVTRTVSARLDRAVTLLDDPAWVARGAALAVPAAVAPAAVVPVTAAPAVAAPAPVDSATVRLRVPRRVVSLEEVAAGPDQGDPGLSRPVAVEPARAPEPSPIWSLPVSSVPTAPAPVPESSVPVGPAREAAAGPATDIVPAVVPAAEASVEPAAGAVDAVVVPDAATREIEPVVAAPAVAALVAEPVAGPAVARPGDEPVAEAVDAGSKPRAVPVRTPAVFDAPARRGPRSRSLSRLLVGAGAVAAAALVVVALFRPGGPLDPPLDPSAGIPRVTGAQVVPGPLPTTGAPAGGGFPGGVFPGGGLPVDGASAAVRMTEPLRHGRADDRAGVDRPGAGHTGTDHARTDRPGGDRPVVDRGVERAAVDSPARAGDDRSPSDTGPAPDVRVTGSGPAGHSMAAQGDERPVGAATRVPPTPAPPRA